MNDMLRAYFEALPEYSIGGTLRAVTNPETGETIQVREPQRFLARRHQTLIRDSDGQGWMVFTDQDGVTWREKIG